jgi:RNA polymerase sigma-70 factor (ECF subfamily)
VDTVDLHVWYERYGEAVFRRCLRIVGDEALAMDLLQETFLRAHKYRASFKGASALSWLLTIADRTSLTALGARPRVSSAEEVERFLETEADPKEPFTQHRLVAELLTRADERTRAIVMHRYFDELELEDIARRLDVNERTVRRKLEQFLADSRRFVERRA